MMPLGKLLSVVVCVVGWAAICQSECYDRDLKIPQFTDLFNESSSQYGEIRLLIEVNTARIQSLINDVCGNVRSKRSFHYNGHHLGGLGPIRIHHATSTGHLNSGHVSFGHSHGGHTSHVSSGHGHRSHVSSGHGHGSHIHGGHGSKMNDHSTSKTVKYHSKDIGVVETLSKLFNGASKFTHSQQFNDIVKVNKAVISIGKKAGSVILDIYDRMTGKSLDVTLREIQESKSELTALQNAMSVIDNLTTSIQCAINKLISQKDKPTKFYPSTCNYQRIVGRECESDTESK